MEEVELIKALASLIEAEMQLPKDRFVIYNQPNNVPDDDGLFGWITYNHSRPFGSSTRTEVNTVTDSLDEVQHSWTQETYSISLMSRDGSARKRNWELPLCLASIRSQQLQERYGFKLGFIPESMIDISAVEASARLNRYSLTFNILRSYERRKPVEYYSRFGRAVPPLILTNQ